MTLIVFLITILFFVFITGLTVGSFLNVIILRAFTKESIAYPPSKCPACQTPLKWYQNIPIVSYLVLKGKCAFCEEKISVQYPLVEFITGILFVAVFLKYGIDFNALFMLIFTSLFIVIAATDIKEKVVFDFHTYALVFLGLIYNLFNLGHFYMGDKVLYLGHWHLGVNNSLIASILGVLLGIVIMELFARFGYLVAGTRAFGEGDSFIAAGLGAVFGWKYLITVLLYAFILQIVLTIPMFLKKLYQNEDYRTLISFIAFFFVLLVMKILEYQMILTNFAIYVAFALVLAGLGFYVCKRIIGGIRNNKESMTMLPFGPAMVVGGFIMMFLTLN